MQLGASCPSQSGLLKVLLTPANSSTRVENVDIWDNTMLVLFSAQTCPIPPNMKESVQDFHPLILKHVELHGDSDTDGSDELLRFVSTPIETLQLSHPSIS